MERDQARMIPMEGVLNVRELGGLPLKNGRMVRYGALLRTGRLSDLTQRDRETLEQFGLTKIIDMRNDQEVSEHPDPQLPGVTWIQLSIFPGLAAGISREDNGESQMDKAVKVAKYYSGGKASQLLRTMYPSMVREEFCVGQIRHFFGLLLEHEEGAVAWHCTSGKDRTGLTGALLLYALGAEWETAVEDYLLTNEQTKKYRDELCAGVAARGVEEEAVEQLRVLESVNADYLEICLTVIREKYGSLDAFMEKQLGLTAEVLSQLRKKYTVAKSGL